MSTINKLKEAGECALVAGIILGSPITVTAYVAYLFLSGKVTWKELISDRGGTPEPPKKPKRQRKSTKSRRRARRQSTSDSGSSIQSKE